MMRLRTDRSEAAISASRGALLTTWQTRKRTLDVDVRVGSHELDNTHPLRGDPLSSYERFARDSWQVPLDDSPERLAPTIWIATDSTLSFCM